MNGSKRTFKSEDERMQAMTAIDEDSPTGLTELEEIRNAQIIPDGGTPAEKPEAEAQITPEPTPQQGQKPPAEKPPAEKPPEGKPPETPAGGEKPPEQEQADEVFTISKKDLPAGYKTPGHVFKALGEAQNLISRQSTYIRENLAEKSAEAPPAQQRAVERAEEAGQQLQKAGPSQASKETMAGISSVNEDIKKIEQLQNELDEQAKDDPDVAYTPEYQQKQRQLSALQTKNLNTLATLLNQATQEARDAKRAADEVFAGTQREKEEARGRDALQSLYQEVDTLDIPELKLSRPVKEVEAEFVQWRDGVAMAYYGRPAKDDIEKFAALEQLQLKNPELVSRCQVMQVPIEPSEDVQRYLAICEANDYCNGYRKDPVTGKLTRLMKYDPNTNSQVPLVLPSLKAAIQQQRLEQGYYDKKEDAAYQHGAEGMAQANMRRDQGAVELGGGADQTGSQGGTQKWASDTLLRIDPEEAMQKYRQGDKTLVDEINRARKILGMDPLVLDEE